MRSARSAWVFAALCFTAVAASAFAAVAPITRPVGGTVATPIIVRPTVSAVLPPALSAQGHYVGALPDGTRVPLSRLPMLPHQTAFNTVTPKNSHGRYRPFAASGAYIYFGGTACGGQLGDLYPVGCAPTWQSLGNDAVDTKQDYYIIPGNGNEFIAGATTAGGTYTAATGASHTNTPASLATTGTYIFGTYDVTAGKWVSVIYVNAGQVFGIKVYSDPFHTSESYQFDAGAGGNAYIYLANVAQSDYYVVGIAQTAVHPNCVFMAPAPTPSPYAYPANQLCQVSASAGIQAPGGNLSVTWPLTSGLTAGTYSVEVYDITANQRLGQVQISMTSNLGTVITTYPDVSGPSPNASSTPAAAQTPSTIVAWDGGAAPGPQDESVTGIKATVAGVPSGNNYLWTLIDPQGQVSSSVGGTIAVNNTGALVFPFDSLTGGQSTTLLPPGRYPAKSWVAQLYNTTSKTVVASQSFEILGYSTLTEFNIAGTIGTSMPIASGGSLTAGIRVTNNSSVAFNGMGDNLAKMIFSTGTDFQNSAATGNGVMVSTTAGNPCTSCSTTATDSAGNIWNVNVKCSGAAVTNKGECTIEFDPQTAGTTLAPGAYVEIDGLTWFYSATANCGSSCQGITSELPQHGVLWSCVTSVGSCANTSSSLAWTPVYFRNTSSTYAGTATFTYIGSYNETTLTSSGTLPWTTAHYYQSYFNQAEYNESSPYNSPIGSVGAYGSTNMEVQQFVINNKSTTAGNITQLAISFPAILHNQSWLALPGGSSFAFEACPAGFRSATICYTTPNIAKGGSATLTQYETPTLQSFAFTEMSMFADIGGTWFQLTNDGTAPKTLDHLYTLDSLAVGTYSLIASDMTGYFSPSTVGNGTTTTPLGFYFGNTSTSVDPNPDSVDILVLEGPATPTLNTTPTVSAAGWSMLSPLAGFTNNGGTTKQYWFGLCATPYTLATSVTGPTYGGPEQAGGGAGDPLTSQYKNIQGTTTSPTCNETQSILPGGSLTVTNMQFSGLTTNGTTNWKLYAHGTNGAGWSAAQLLPLTISSDSAQVWFNTVNGTAVSTNTVPTIGSSPNSYQYAIKNTNKTAAIGTIDITLPGDDINGQNAFDGTTAWNIASIDTAGTITLSFPAGQADGIGGCSVSTLAAKTFNPTNAGVNGQIEVNGCTTFKPGDTLYVNFTATNPSAESDSYVFPTLLDSATQAGTAWLGSSTINEQFSVGLDIVVDPSNPGPGGSTPVVNCANACSFSGSAIDFGNIANNQTFAFQDVVRTSVIYTGTTSAGHNLDLYIDTNLNPANSSGSPTNELLTEIDSARSSPTGGITFNVPAYTVVPTAPSMMETAIVPETNRVTPYDIINSFEVAIGATDTITARIATITYTLIPV